MGEGGDGEREEKGNEGVERRRTRGIQTCTQANQQRRRETDKQRE